MGACAERVCGEVITIDHRLATFSDGNAEQAQSEVLTRAQREREREGVLPWTATTLKNEQVTEL